MKKTSAFLLLPAFLCLACLFSGPAAAERADRNKPMNIEADALRYDDLKQTSVFTGRVVVTKGTIIIRGARMDVRQDPEGYQFGVVTAEPGKLAFFRQKREGLDEYIEGEGEVIEYDSKSDNVKFIKRAEMRRFRGSTVNDEMTGNLIVYDNSTDIFTVDSGAAQGAPAVGGGRIKAMLTPSNAASAPAAPVGNQPSPSLRPSTTMGGEKK
ncbi:MAG: lipopolysaccharide transport periplasmic protein LptA [Comamonadaceae bacterium]|nr:MAG: lipopolysaccharide transport periplasmic protein LptA [Comamonadaceae bacterium]